MNVNVQAVYTTFMGEQNIQGIGAPVVFLRLGGCHIRCYKATKGILCDTPEALEKGSGEDMTISQAVALVVGKAREAGGIPLVCLSGGDPLWRHKDVLHELFTRLENTGMHTVVETSGTIDWRPFRDYDASFVLDFKTPSAGIPEKMNLVEKYHEELKEDDYIKFVIDGDSDYQYFLEKFELIKDTRAHITIGPFWGGNYDPVILSELLERDGILGKVKINMQAHKMAVSSDYTKSIPEKI